VDKLRPQDVVCWRKEKIGKFNVGIINYVTLNQKFTIIKGRKKAIHIACVLFISTGAISIC